MFRQLHIMSLNRYVKTLNLISAIQKLIRHVEIVAVVLIRCTRERWNYFKYLINSN